MQGTDWDSLGKLGWEPVDLVNFPGRLAAAVFVQGCPLRCPYCHNRSLTGPLPRPGHSWGEGLASRTQVMEHLVRRRGMLTGLVIGGGEPTMHPGLSGLVGEAGSLGYRVKVDTCGFFPDNLARCLEPEALEYIGLDLKTSPENYGRVGPPEGGLRLLESLELLVQWLKAAPLRRLDLRTTMARGVTEPEDLRELEILAADVISRTAPGQVRYSRREAVT